MIQRLKKRVDNRKCCTKHMELMEARLTVLEQPHWPLTDNMDGTVLLVVNYVEVHLTSSKAKGLVFLSRREQLQ